MSNKSTIVHTSRPARTRGHKNNPRNPGSILARAAILSFVCGTALCVMLLCVFSVLLANTPLPLTLVRPFSCVAVAAGVALSGVLFSKQIGRQFLLCGLFCGLFYAVCQLIAAFILQGTDFWRNGSLLLTAVLLMSGLFGGAFAAARAVR